MGFPALMAEFDDNALSDATVSGRSVVSKAESFLSHSGWDRHFFDAQVIKCRSSKGFTVVAIGMRAAQVVVSS